MPLLDVISCLDSESIVFDRQLSKGVARILAKLKKPSPAKMTGSQNHTLEETAYVYSFYSRHCFVGKLAYAASLEGSTGGRPERQGTTLDVSSAYLCLRDDDLGRGRLR